MSHPSLSHSSRSHSHGRMPEFVKNIIEENKKHNYPWRQVKEMIFDVKDEFKTFRGSPALISKAVLKCKEHVVEFVQKAIEEVKQENPELVTELEKKREERMDKREAKRLARQIKDDQKRGRKEEKRAKKEAKKEEKRARKEAKKLSPEASPNKAKRQQEIRQRINIIQPIFKDMKRPDIRKEVVSDLDAGNDVQVTIKRLFQN